MKRLLTLSAIAMLTLTLGAACGGKKDGGGGGDADNPFAQRKASIDAYMTAIEGAGGDADKAIAAGQAWLDANLAAYKDNCKTLVEYRQDLDKSKLSKGVSTPLQEYMDRANAAAGFDAKNPDMAKMKKAGELLKQLNSFFLCDTALKS